LAIRWFAWACRKDPTMWSVGIRKTNVRELEGFCVAHTLGVVLILKLKEFSGGSVNHRHCGRDG
jgi:hypothetical protein